MQIGEAHVHVGPEMVCTEFPDGTRVDACPVFTEEEYGRAKALGYGTGDEAVRGMTRDHDVLHSVLAHARGRSHSEVLWGVAHGTPVDSALADEEERIVLLLQRVSQIGIQQLVREDFPQGSVQASLYEV